MPKTKGPPWPLREKGCCLDLGWGVWGWRWCCCSEFSLGCCLASHHLRRQGVGLPCLGLFLELSPRIKSERRKKRPAGAAGNEFNDEVWPEFKLILQMSSHRVGQGGCPLGPWPASWAAAPAFSSVVPSLRGWTTQTKPQAQERKHVQASLLLMTPEISQVHSSALRTHTARYFCQEIPQSRCQPLSHLCPQGHQRLGAPGNPVGLNC